MKQHYEEVDLLKGIAIVLVIFGHAIIFFPIDLHLIPWCELVFQLVSTTHMPLFFLVSGFCWSVPASYRRYLLQKCRRILIPYLIFGLADLIPRVLLTQFVNRPNNFPAGLLKMAVAGGEYWFLYVLFLLFLIFPPLGKLMGRGRLPAVLALSAALFLYSLQPWLPDLMRLRTCAGYLFYFSLGYCLRLYACGSGWAVRLHRPFPILLASAGFTAAFLARIPFPGFWPLTVLCALLGSFLAWQAALFLCEHLAAGKKNLRALLGSCGRYSLQLYLLNGFLLVISRTLMVRLLHVEDPAVIILWNTLFDTVVGLLVTRCLLDRFALFRKLSGL